MPETFGKLDVEDPTSVSFVLDAIRKHALTLVKSHLQKAGVVPSPENIETVALVIERWLRAGEQVILSNILCSGLTPQEYLAQASALEPFDDDLMKRLQELAATTDEITRQLNQERRGLPEERARALRRQAKAMRAIQQLRAEEGDEIIDAFRNQELANDEKLLRGIPTLDRPDEVAAAVHQSITDIDALQVSLLERASSSKEHTRLVKRLRDLTP